MIESECPTCGSKLLLPDGPKKTADEKRAFSEAWDAQVRI